MKNEKHRYIRTYNLKELNLTMLEKEKDYVIDPGRRSAPVYCFNNKFNGYQDENTYIILSKEVCEIGFYDNIYFKDFVLTDCEVIVSYSDDTKICIRPKKITLV